MKIKVTKITYPDSKMEDYVDFPFKSQERHDKWIKELEEQVTGDLKDSPYSEMEFDDKLVDLELVNDCIFETLMDWQDLEKMTFEYELYDGAGNVTFHVATRFSWNFQNENI